MKITIGVVQKPFGIKGELKVKPETDFVSDRFNVGNVIYINLNQKITQHKIEHARMHKGSVLLKLEGLDSLNDVEFYHRALVQIEKEAQHELESDEFYFTDLIDLNVYVDGEFLGVVSEVMDLPAHPVLRVKTDEDDKLIPFVETFVEEVDLDSKRIDVIHMEGLL